MSDAFISHGKRSAQGNLNFYAQFVPNPIDRFDRDIHECLQCGMQYIYPMYENGDLAVLYDSEGYQRFRNAISKAALATAANADANKIDYLNYILERSAALGLARHLDTHRQKHKGRAARLLDIGSGEGHELHAFSAMGFDVTGIDLSDPLIAEVKRTYGHEVRKIALEDMDTREKFDVVTAFHLIEHLKDPHALFAKVRDLLNPDGIFLVETPVAEDGGLTAQRFRDIYHTMFFDHFSLALLAAKNGFIPLRMTHRHFHAGTYFHSYMTMVFQYNPVFHAMFGQFETVAILWMKSILSTLIEDARDWGRNDLRYRHKLGAEPIRFPTLATAASEIKQAG
ncbi:MAG: class I SAM-dependent methyltransferase [Alphaproteobacteria bacterium]|nr:class I SAM-dependent methyltransferase [Alphaproteobacteria bacterium]